MRGLFRLLSKSANSVLSDIYVCLNAIILSCRMEIFLSQSDSSISLQNEYVRLEPGELIKAEASTVKVVEDEEDAEEDEEAAVVVGGTISDCLGLRHFDETSFSSSLTGPELLVDPELLEGRFLVGSGSTDGISILALDLVSLIPFSFSDATLPDLLFDSKSTA